MTSPERRSLADLADLAARAGTRVACAGNLPAELDDPDCFWFIDEGAVDLFLVETRDGVQHSAPQHLLRAGAGRLLPGVPPQDGDTTLALIAKGLPGTTMRRLPVAHLGEIQPVELAAQVDAWLSDLSETLVRGVVNRPRPDALVEPEQVLPAQPQTLAARRGVVWISELRAGAGLYLDLIDPAEHGPDHDPGPGPGPDPEDGPDHDHDHAVAVPLTPVSWLTLLDAAPFDVRSSEALAGEGLLLGALASFHAAAFALMRLDRSLAVVDQANLERARARSRRTDEESARRRLFNLYDRRPDDGAAGDSALFEALRIIGRQEGIDFRFPDRAGASDAPVGLDDVIDASGVRTRRVRLDHAHRWWRGDSHAMLAFRKEDGRPVALLPGRLGRYREIDPVERRRRRVTSERAAALSEEAWLFYPPLPSRGVGLADLFRIAGSGSKLDLTRLVLAGLPGGLILLAPALGLGLVAGQAIPDRDPGLLHAVCMALAALASAGALLHILRNMALLRLEARVVSRAEAAFWDRLLRLPPGVLRRYPVGDLAMRGTTFQHLRDATQGVVADGVLSVVFLLPVFVVIFFHDAGLGGVALVFGLLSLMVTAALGLRRIAPCARAVAAVRRVTGHLFQMVGGMSKLRTDSAEGSAFAVWAREYRAQKKAEMEAGAAESHLQAFGAALPFLAGAVLLLATALPDRPAIPVADFLVVFTVFMAFQTAVSRLGESFAAVAEVAPTFEQIRPLLAEPPEVVTRGREPVEHLGGDILFDQVSFRYDPDGPLILDDVTIHARPGEFIAIAGESGAGKSTLLRLALGLDQPCGGAVYYDRRDLRRLDAKQLRRRIGVVPQAVQLHPQDLWDNIVAHHEGASTEEVWQAVEAAGIAPEIRAMLMGMLTPVGTSASVTSGGESQRIMIARALLRSPRILLLDEATNWLDNESQAKVMENLAALTATRIVIAHRLSTLRRADHVYVMRAGRVVQSGTFGELTEADGEFRELIRRQMA